MNRLLLLVFLLCPTLVLAQYAPSLVLVAAGDAVANTQYSASVAVPVSSRSGEMLGYTLVSNGTVVPIPAGTLMVFKADPGTSAGDPAITTVARDDVVCQIPFSVADWDSDANGGSAYLASPPCAFPSGRANLFAVWKHLDAVALDATTHVLKVTFIWSTP